MARQHTGKNKPSLNQNKKTNPAVRIAKKKVRTPKKAKRRDSPTQTGAGNTGPCALRCGTCVSCLIYKGDAENDARIRLHHRWY